MTWVSKYWGVLANLYWTPKYLGLRSISKSAWKEEEGFILIPRESLSKGGSIYTRDGNWLANDQNMRGLEETLNHIFNITFAIAPDSVVRELLHQPAGIEDRGPLETVGREMPARLGLGKANFAQQDGLFISPQAILSVELKLSAKTSREQMLKYLMITLLEEKRGGKRSDIGLLYITPHDAAEVMHQAGATEGGQLPEGFIAQFQLTKLNATARRIIESDREGMEDVASRIRLSHISWAALVSRSEDVLARLDMKSVGNQTLARLLQGFVNGVRDHKGTGL